MSFYVPAVWNTLLFYKRILKFLIYLIDLVYEHPRSLPHFQRAVYMIHPATDVMPEKDNFAGSMLCEIAPGFNNRKFQVISVSRWTIHFHMIILHLKRYPLT